MPSVPPDDNLARPFSNPISEADDLISRLLADTSEMFEQAGSSRPAPGPAQLSVDDLLNMRSSSSAAVSSPTPPYIPPGPTFPSAYPAMPPYIPPGPTMLPVYQESPPPLYQGYNPYPTGLVRPDFAARPATSVEAANFGYDRGFFHYQNEFGETVLLEKAGFGSRLRGAIVDSIIAGILVTIFTNTIGSFITSSLIDGNTAYREASYSGSQRVIVNTLTDIIITAALVTGLLGATVSALYYILMVGLNGQTLGHRAVNLRVIRGGGRPADLIAAAIRALYGALPGICTFGLLPVIVQEVILRAAFSRTSSSAGTSNIMVIVLLIAAVSLLILFGFLWILFDKK